MRGRQRNSRDVQIVLGLAAYGHSYNVTPAAAIGAGGLNVYPAIGGVRPAGPSDIQGDATPDACGNPPVVSGVFTCTTSAHRPSVLFLGVDRVC